MITATMKTHAEPNENYVAIGERGARWLVTEPLGYHPSTGLN